MEHLGKAWAKTTCSPQWKFHRRAFGDGSCESCFAFKAWSTSCNKSSTALCHSRCLRLSVPPPNADGYHGSSGPKIKGYRVDHFAFFRMMFEVWIKNTYQLIPLRFFYGLETARQWKSDLPATRYAHMWLHNIAHINWPQGPTMINILWGVP